MATALPRRAHLRPWLGGWYLLVPLVALALFRDLWAPDEPRYAQIAREAFETQSFLVMHLCGDVYPDKPPLLYWLAGATGRLGGWSEFALRIPAILATIGSAILAARIARRHLGETVAAWTPVFFLGTAMVVWFGGRLQIDPLLTFFCLAAVHFAWIDGGTPAERTRRLLLAGLCTGLAALSKGPVAWLHVGLALAALRFAPGAARDAVRFPARAWVGFVALAVLPVAAWAVAAAIREPRLWAPLFAGQHVGRATDTDAPHAGPPWEHLWQLPLLFFPWTGFLVLGLVQAFRTWRRTARGDERAASLARISAWLTAVLFVFSLIPPKRELYLLPIYPAGAWLAAAAFERALAGGRIVPWATLTASALFLLSGIAAVVAPHVDVRAASYSGAGILVALPLIGGAVASFAFLRRRDLARWADSLALGATGAIFAAAVGILPPVDVEKSARTLSYAVAHRPETPERIPCVGVQPEGYRFYGRVPTVRADVNALLAQLEHDGRNCLALVSASEWTRLSPDTRARFAVLHEQRVGSRMILLLGRSSAASGM